MLGDISRRRNGFLMVSFAAALTVGRMVSSLISESKMNKNKHIRLKRTRHKTLRGLLPLASHTPLPPTNSHTYSSPHPSPRSKPAPPHAHPLPTHSIPVLHVILHPSFLAVRQFADGHLGRHCNPVKPTQGQEADRWSGSQGEE